MTTPVPPSSTRALHTWSAGPDGEIVSDSPAWRAYTGRSMDQALGWGWVDAIHPEDRAALYERWQAALASGTELKIVYRVRRHDGAYRHFAVQASPLRSPEGAIIEWLGANVELRHPDEDVAGAFQDAGTQLAVAAAEQTLQLTHLRQLFGRETGEDTLEAGLGRLMRDLTAQTAEALRQKSILAGLFNHLPAGMAHLDANLIFQRVNLTYAQLFRRSPEDFPGHHVFRIFPGTEDQVGAPLKSVLETGRPFTAYSFPFVYPDGEASRTSYWDFTYAPVHNERGEVTGILALGFEVSTRVQLEQEVAERNRELERLSLAKDEFIGVVSHELRSPLTAIRSAASIIESGRAGALSADQARFAQLIKAESARLSALVDDLLDLQRLENDGPVVALVAQDVLPVVHEIAESFAPVMQARQLSFSVEAPKLPLIARIDPLRLGQVLMNLLSNAASFTPEGGEVRLGAAAVDGEIRLWVRDNGEGIPPEAQGQVFEKFVQVPGAQGRKSGGTGLGLAICKHLIETGHGGRIWLESEPGHGSTFTIALPRA